MKIFLFYTDPGSGIMLLQILFAFFASGAFYFRKYFYKLFGRSRVSPELEGIDGPATGAAEHKEV